MNKKMADRIRFLCKAVGPAKQTIIVARKDIDALQQKLSQATTERMKNIILGAIEQRQSQQKKAEAVVVSFMSSVDGLDLEERNVMMQLYIKQKKWSEIDSLAGKRMNAREVNTIYKRALRRMALNAESMSCLAEKEK